MNLLNCGNYLWHIQQNKQAFYNYVDVVKQLNIGNVSNVSFTALIENLYKNFITCSYIHLWSTTHSLRPCNANILAYAKMLFPSNFLFIFSKIKIYPKSLLHLVTFMVDYTLTETMQCKYNSLCQKDFSFQVFAYSTRCH